MLFCVEVIPKVSVAINHKWKFIGWWKAIILWAISGIKKRQHLQYTRTPVLMNVPLKRCSLAGRKKSSSVTSTTANAICHENSSSVWKTSPGWSCWMTDWVRKAGMVGTRWIFKVWKWGNSDKYHQTRLLHYRSVIIRSNLIYGFGRISGDSGLICRIQMGLGLGLGYAEAAP